MPADAHPLLTADLLGTATPDRTQFGVFSEYPRVFRSGEYRERSRWIENAERYFRHHPGAEFHEDEDHDNPLGPHFSMRQGHTTLSQGNGLKSLSMSATFNRVRELVAAAGIDNGADGPDDNTLVPMLDQGYRLEDLRRGICADIATRAVWAASRYEEFLGRAFGFTSWGTVMVNFSQLEIAYDVPTAVPGVLRSYARPFYKVFIKERHKRERDRLSGRLRKGERFAIYDKGGIIRFETSVTGTWIKKIAGSQRVPLDGSGVERVLLALETRYLPIWLEVERYRLTSARPSLRDFVARLPRIRSIAALDDVAEDLGRDGKVATGSHPRGLVDALCRKGLLDNLAAKTGVRGYRVAKPGTDGLWRAWRIAQ